jgi:hypothetical protein
MPIKPMSPEAAEKLLLKLMQEAVQYGSHSAKYTSKDRDCGYPEPKMSYDGSRETIRTALASVLSWAAEECRPEPHVISASSDEVLTIEVGNQRHAISQYHAALLKAAEEIG